MMENVENGHDANLEVIFGKLEEIKGKKSIRWLCDYLFKLQAQRV